MLDPAKAPYDIVLQLPSRNILPLQSTKQMLVRHKTYIRDAWMPEKVPAWTPPIRLKFPVKDLRQGLVTGSQSYFLHLCVHRVLERVTMRVSRLIKKLRVGNVQSFKPPCSSSQIDRASTLLTSTLQNSLYPPRCTIDE